MAGDSDAVYPEDLKPEIRDVLEAVCKQCAGSFSITGQLENPPSPGLNVKGVGSVGLPLSDRDAQILRSVCHQAPFGKGSDTIVDTSVRNTLQVNSSDVELVNPKWHSYVSSLLPSISSQLGIPSSDVHAELYKLLLYEEGAHFDKHKDSEKADGMFGTLVISLPSKHTGGDVQTSFRGSNKVLNTSRQSPFGYSYLAWYSDVEHAVEKVSSGRRLVLTYNLIHKGPGQKHSAAARDAATQELIKVLRPWAENAKEEPILWPQKLAYMLDHEYTDASLQLSHLKGKDAIRARALQQAAEGAQCMFLLANVEKSIEGGCEESDDHPYYGGYRGNYRGNVSYDTKGQVIHEIVDEIDRTFELSLVVRADGSILAQNIDITDEDLVQEDWFERNPDEERDYSGYTGNEGVTTTHVYRNSCVLLIPKNLVISFLFRAAKDGKVDAGSWLQSLLQEFAQSPTAELEADVRNLSDLILSHMEDPQKRDRHGSSYGFSWREPEREHDFTNETLAPVFRAASLFRNKDLFERAALLSKAPHDAETNRTIGRAIRSVSFQAWRKGLDSYLHSMDHMHQKFGSLSQLMAGLEDTSDETQAPAAVISLFREWYCDIVDNVLRSRPKTSKTDGKVLVAAAKVCGEKYLSHVILPFVKSRISEVAFVIEFLTDLGDRESHPAIKDAEAIAAFQDVSVELIKGFKLDFDDVPSNEEGLNGISFQSSGTKSKKQQQPDKELTAEKLLTFVRRCFAFNLKKEVDVLLDKLEAEAARTPPGSFKVFILLLQQLPDLLLSNSIPYATPRYRAFYQNMFTLYLRLYVKARPINLTTWAEDPKIGCPCILCHDLLSFLRNPLKQVAKYRMSNRDCAHIHEQCNRYTTATHETEWVNNVLVVTKNKNKYHADEAAWKKRFDQALADIRGIGTPDVRATLLGEDMRDLHMSVRDPTPSTRVPFVRYAFEGGSIRPREPLADIGQQASARLNWMNTVTSKGGRSQTSPTTKWGIGKIVPEGGGDEQQPPAKKARIGPVDGVEVVDLTIE